MQSFSFLSLVNGDSPEMTSILRGRECAQDSPFLRKDSTVALSDNHVIVRGMDGGNWQLLCGNKNNIVIYSKSARHKCE